MIQFLADNIDQLDLALDQLAIHDRNFDRFALMLIDNVVELTLHRIAQDKASESKMWGTLIETTYDLKIIKNALGQDFNAKAKAAHSFNIIDSNLYDSILNLHSFRNTAYHKGLRHEKILHSIALFYFQCVCDLLKNYKPNSWSWSSTDKISHRAMKYIGNHQFGHYQEKFSQTYHRLSEIALTIRQNLVDDLTADMSDTIESINNDIDFLATDNPTQTTRNQVIIDVQVWSFAFTDEGKKYIKDHGYDETVPCKSIDWLSKNYNWSIKNDPIPSWRSRLSSLSKETNLHMALKKYCDFMRQTENIRSLISEASFQLDTHIQQQVDMMRGK